MSIKEHPPQNSEYKLHIPVLLNSCIELINPQKGESYLDLTAGYGGHARNFFNITENYEQSVLVDRDINAINELDTFRNRGVEIIHSDFVSASKDLIKRNKKFDIILIDLGVSSPQLDKGERGFSFKYDGPLDMRMDESQDLTAEKIINTYSVNNLKEIFIKFGEEKPSFSNRIAEEIVKRRPLHTTTELANLIKNIYRGKWRKTHPATRTFQALRIEVNKELMQVETILPLLPSLLHHNGRVGVISFHSLEDRLVKNFFKEQSNAGFESELKILNKKPIDGAIYDVYNPRSRSAKLRVAVKK